MRREFFEWRFRQAAGDYYALLNKGYPEKRSRRLVADRYQLNTAQRTVLYRGVFSEEVNRRRREQLLDAAEVRQHVLLIDFLNLIYLLMNYLYGRNLFIATDGIMRDDGENYDEFSSLSIFSHVIELIKKALSEIQPPTVEIVVDHPHLPLAFDILQDAAALSEEFSDLPADIHIHFSAAADRYLRCRRNAVLLSADSRIIDRCNARVFDMAFYILDRTYQADFPRLLDVIASAENGPPAE